MRWPSLISLLALSACSPFADRSQPPRANPATAIAPPDASSSPASPPSPQTNTPPPPSTTTLTPPRLASKTISGITFEGVAFDSRSHRLRVLDQPAGPGSRWPDAESAGKSIAAIAAINAGFFTPEGSPLGKLVTAGNPVGSWNRSSSLGSGVWLETPGGQSSILRRESAINSPTPSEMIQAGPLLTENTRKIPGLESTKPAVRILILWDGNSRWWIGRASPCSLAALAEAIASGKPAGWTTRSALNLDGGRSSDLWISPSVAGGPLLRRSFLNRPVRNFLALVPR